jgi:hypothetical protein
MIHLKEILKYENEMLREQLQFIDCYTSVVGCGEGKNWEYFCSRWKPKFVHLFFMWLKSSVSVFSWQQVMVFL